MDSLPRPPLERPVAAVMLDAGEVTRRRAPVVWRLLASWTMKRAAFVPFWAWQFLGGTVVVLIAVSVFAVVVGAAIRVPSSFLDDIGKTVARIAPQPRPDVASEDQLKKVITAMPNGR